MRVNRRNACGGAFEEMDWCKHRLNNKARPHRWIFLIKGNQMQYLNLVLFSQHVYGWKLFCWSILVWRWQHTCQRSDLLKCNRCGLVPPARQCLRWNSPCSSTASFFCSDSLTRHRSPVQSPLPFVKITSSEFHMWCPCVCLHMMWGGLYLAWFFNQNALVKLTLHQKYQENYPHNNLAKPCQQQQQQQQWWKWKCIQSQCKFSQETWFRRCQ